MLLATGIPASAQDEASDKSNRVSEVAGENASPANSPPINFEVLERRKVSLGNRSIILNRVAPPVLPVPPLPPPPPSAEQIAAREAMEALQPRKKYEVLFLSATVYDDQVTALRWSDQNGSYLAYSNIDFSHLASMGEFQTDAAVYMLIMGIGSVERAQTPASDRTGNPQKAGEGRKPAETPLLSEFSPTRSEYFVVDDPAHPVADEACAAIEALHVYFDANKQRIVEDSGKRETARRAKEIWDKEHPPNPKDTVIHFWPEKSTVYPTAPVGGVSR